MTATGRLSVVIVAWNSASDLPTCLASLQASALRSGIDLHTVVIDNASDDDSAGVAERGGADFVLRNPLNAGFAVAASQGLALSVHPWVFFANADLELAPDALGQLLAAAHGAGEDVASFIPDVRFRADPQIVNTRGIEVDRYGIPFEFSAGQPASDLPRRVPFGGTGGACLFRAKAVAEAGGFEPAYFAYMEDVDLAWRLQRLGYRAEFVHEAEALHLGSASTGEGSPLKSYLVARNRRLLFRVHGPRGLRRAAVRNARDLAHCGVQVALTKSLEPVRGRAAALRALRYMSSVRKADELRGLRPAASIAHFGKDSLLAALRRKKTSRNLMKH